MCLELIGKFLDNATVAGLVTVGFGMLAGKSIYREQKKIDRQYQAGDRLVEALMIMEEHCKSINQSIDRLACTYKRIMEDQDKAAMENFANSLKFEIDPMAMTLMYKIPEDTGKIGSIVSLYFDKNKEIEDSVKRVFDELKKWHDFVQAHATGKSGQPFNLEKRVSEIKELSLDELTKSIKDVAARLR